MVLRIFLVWALIVLSISTGGTGCQGIGESKREIVQLHPEVWPSVPKAAQGEVIVFKGVILRSSAQAYA